MCTCEFCGRDVHKECMSKHAKLSTWVGNIALSCACFECALYCGVLEGKAPESVSSPYYAQIDWRDCELKSSSLTLGGLVAKGQLGEIWSNPEETNDVCESCHAGGDLLSCSWCNVAYHNTTQCLRDSKLGSAAMDSESYEWACPSCFKGAVRQIIKPKRKPPPPKKRAARGRAKN